MEKAFEEIVTGLRSLEDGWCGPGSPRPPAAVVDAVEGACRHFSLTGSRPPTSAEVDEDDGTVSLLWIAEDGSRSFWLTFLPSGDVIGGRSSLPTEPGVLPWKMPAANPAAVAYRAMQSCGGLTARNRSRAG